MASIKDLKCEFCKTYHTNKYNLDRHQKTTKKCIEIQKSQGLQVEVPLTKCPHCNVDYSFLGIKTHLDLCPVKKAMDKNVIKIYGGNATININQAIVDSNEEKSSYPANTVANPHELDRDTSDTDQDHYIYCIMEREFVKTGENIYKVGKSTQVFKRIKHYPNDSKVILIAKVKDCHKAEIELLNGLDGNPCIRRANKIGREYYECDDLKSLVSVFNSVYINNL
jgi:hypothetical protein